MVADHNQTIQVKNARQMTSITACFWQRVGWLLDPLIPLYNVPTPPTADNDEMGLTGVEQNNPSGYAAESDNDRVVFFKALTALPALEDSFKDNDDDDTLSTALGLLANGSNVAALTTVGLLADRINAPLALAEDADAMPQVQVPALLMGILLAMASQATMVLLALQPMGAQHHRHLLPLLLLLLGALPPWR
jgi:hypothetical protein